MAYATGKRRKSLVTLRDAIRTSGYFKKVFTRQPGRQIPGSGDCPLAYVSASTERIDWGTNEEQASEQGVALFAIVYARADLDLVKVDAVDAILKSIDALLSDSTFRAEFDRVDIDLVELGPLALQQYGIPIEGLEPPYGAARIDARVSFYSQAL